MNTDRNGKLVQTVVLVALAIVATMLGGCMERKVSITSEPSGATVYANDVELGRTPLEASFTYFGEYDVLVAMDGYEPKRVMAKARSPIYEYPPIDLAANAVPFNIETVVKWHFKLEPALETTQSKEELEKGLLERAAKLRGELK